MEVWNVLGTLLQLGEGYKVVNVIVGMVSKSWRVNIQSPPKRRQCVHCKAFGVEERMSKQAGWGKRYAGAYAGRSPKRFR